MKKMNLNKKRNRKSFISMVFLAACTLFMACEKNEESSLEKEVSSNIITGEYLRLDFTIINAENGIPQKPETLEAFIGDELHLFEDGSFKSPTKEGEWVQKENTLFLYSVDGLAISLQVKKADGQTLGLLQEYDSYDDYADGLVSYTFIKKGNEISPDQDLLSFVKMWF